MQVLTAPSRDEKLQLTVSFKKDPNAMWLGDDFAIYN